MGRVLMTGGGGGGGSSDDCTATANDILKGKTAVYNGSGDEPQEGTLELTGDAADGYVYSGKTYYNTDARTKRTGTMTVGSILNFSAAAYSGRQVLLKWQNPYAATGKPFGGVFINYSTSGYPGTGGTRIYTGYGNNSASGGWSQVVVTLPNLNTTYYFSCIAYCPCSVCDILGNTMNASCRTSGNIDKTITWSQNYTVPAGYNYVDIFCVGGGGAGRGGWSDSGGYQHTGGGGGGGYTSTAPNINVSGGQVLNCSVGMAAAPTAEVFPVGCTKFVPLIEGENFNSAELKEAVAEYAAPLKKAGVDALILSCTHYPFIKEQIEKELGAGVTVIDPAEATSRLAIQVLHEAGLAKTAGEGKVTVCATADIERVQRLAKRMLPLEDCEFKEISLALK